MHSHSHHNKDNHKHKDSENKKSRLTEIKKNLINLALALVFLAITPFLLNVATEYSLQEVREQYQEDRGVEAIRTELGKITSIQEENGSENDVEYTLQTLKVLNQDNKTRTVEMYIYPDSNLPELEKNQKIYISVTEDLDGNDVYSYSDIYRLDKIFWVLALFIALVIYLTGIKGFGAFVGLIFATLIIFSYLLPEILLGSGILFTTFVSAILIAGFSMFLSHGFNRFTLIAVGGTLLTIILVGVLSYFVTEFVGFSGVTSHELSHLQAFELLSQTKIDLQGLFLASIILGSLGVLDDVTISQAVIVQELRSANQEMDQKELFKKAMIIGQEHIISLINTLSIAYIATGLPFVIQFIVFGYEDLFALLNSEVISGEIVRTLVGSIALLSAIPITTLLAVRFGGNEE